MGDMTVAKTGLSSNDIVNGVTTPTTMLPDLLPCQWIQELVKQTTQAKATLDCVLADIKMVDKNIELCTDVISTETTKLTDFKKQKDALRSKLHSVRNDVKVLEDVNQDVRHSDDCLLQILKHQGTHHKKIRIIVNQTQSAVKITFNSLRHLFDNLPQLEETFVSTKESLRSNLMKILELAYKNESHPEVKEATVFLETFIVQQAHHVKLILEIDAKQAGKAMRTAKKGNGTPKSNSTSDGVEENVMDDNILDAANNDDKRKEGPEDNNEKDDESARKKACHNDQGNDGHNKSPIKRLRVKKELEKAAKPTKPAATTQENN